MSAEMLAWLGAGMTLAGAAGVLVAGSGRWRVAALAVLHSGAVMGLQLMWPLSLLGVWLAAGWLAALLLAVAQREAVEVEPLTFGERLGRSSAVVLIALAAFSLAPQTTAWIPFLARAAAFAGLTLIGVGFVMLGMAQTPLGWTLGLLMVLDGFVEIYAAVEQSVLVVGLLAVLALGLALLAGYFLSAEEVA